MIWAGVTEPGGGIEPGATLKKVWASVKVAAHSVCKTEQSVAHTKLGQGGMFKKV